VSRWYHAPDDNTVTVALGPHDDLTFGASIYDQDWRTHERVFVATRSIPSRDVTPGRYTIRDGQIELTVLIDVIVGPEAGDKPDLIITDVTSHGGQLRIHVFNNAAALENRDIDVNLVRISTNEQIAFRTWENVSIPSGGERVLQSADLTLEPYDLRVIVDPENAIDETDASNNIFETPVVMQVAFASLTAPLWTCEGWAQRYAEAWFHFSVGYGPSEEDVYWVAHRERYPDSGVVRWINGDNRFTRWSLADLERFTFTFEMPAGDNLYILIRGYEQDSSSNQLMGTIRAAYHPFANYGAQEATYSEDSTGVGECNEWLHPRGDNLSRRSFVARWDISRIH
jgi:hypothetical protein